MKALILTLLLALASSQLFAKGEYTLTRLHLTFDEAKTIYLSMPVEAVVDDGRFVKEMGSLHCSVEFYKVQEPRTAPRFGGLRESTYECVIERWL